MSLELTPIQCRVLGSLMEKSVTTPEYYPLTLNSLVLACNQKSSRDPVTDYDEDEVLATLDELRDLHLVIRVDMAGSRVAKFRHQVSESWELSHAEYAVMALLLLRGAQTVGQLRQRSERLHGFRDISEVEEVLEAMQQREPEPQTLIRVLPLRPGSKEPRFEHALSPYVEPPEDMDQEGPLRATVDNASRSSVAELREQVALLSTQVESLKNEMADLRAELGEFKSLF